MTGGESRTESQRVSLSLYLQYAIDQAAARFALLATVLMTTALVLRSRVRRKHALSLPKGLKHGSEAAVGEVIPPLTVP